jgi:hypothetical protein
VQQFCLHHLYSHPCTGAECSFCLNADSRVSAQILWLAASYFSFWTSDVCRDGLWSFLCNLYIIYMYRCVYIYIYIYICILGQCPFSRPMGVHSVLCLFTGSWRGLNPLSSPLWNPFKNPCCLFLHQNPRFFIELAWSDPLSLLAFLMNHDRLQESTVSLLQSWWVCDCGGGPLSSSRWCFATTNG